MLAPKILSFAFMLPSSASTTPLPSLILSRLLQNLRDFHLTQLLRQGCKLMMVPRLGGVQFAKSIAKNMSYPHYLRFYLYAQKTLKLSIACTKILSFFLPFLFSSCFFCRPTSKNTGHVPACAKVWKNYQVESHLGKCNLGEVAQVSSSQAPKSHDFLSY